MQIQHRIHQSSSMRPYRQKMCRSLHLLYNQSLFQIQLPNRQQDRSNHSQHTLPKQQY